MTATGRELVCTDRGRTDRLEYARLADESFVEIVTVSVRSPSGLESQRANPPV